MSWSDFLAAPQMGADPTAVTSYVLRYTAECDADVFSYTVVAAFVPAQSWVKPEMRMLGPASRRMLQHEQTHFDLAEVHARRIRQALSGLSRPCGMTSEERNAVVRRWIDEDGNVQQRYDRETAHGSDRERQAEWEASVSRQLASLRQYAASTTWKDRLPIAALWCCNALDIGGWKPPRSRASALRRQSRIERSRS